jgi:hypothetical protein
MVNQQLQVIVTSDLSVAPLFLQTRHEGAFDCPYYDLLSIFSQLNSCSKIASIKCVRILRAFIYFFQ